MMVTFKSTLYGSQIEPLCDKCLNSAKIAAGWEIRDILQIDEVIEDQGIEIDTDS